MEIEVQYVSERDHYPSGRLEDSRSTIIPVSTRRKSSEEGESDLNDSSPVCDQIDTRSKRVDDKILQFMPRTNRERGQSSIFPPGYQDGYANEWSGDLHSYDYDRPFKRGRVDGMICPARCDHDLGGLCPECATLEMELFDEQDKQP